MIRLFCIISILLLTGCKQQFLLEDLDQQQANEVVALLLQHNISATKKSVGKAKYNITVNNEDFSTAVGWLKIYDLPARPKIEVSEMFPTDALVSSPRAEKARLYSAIEQRLEQSLHIMKGIVTARVHVSYDIDAGEGGKGTLPIHLSALVIYEKDSDPELLLNEIKRFLVNSFSGVDYSNISVVLSLRNDAVPTLSLRDENISWLNDSLLYGFIIFIIVLTVVICLFLRKKNNKV